MDCLNCYYYLQGQCDVVEEAGKNDFFKPICIIDCQAGVDNQTAQEKLEFERGY